MSAKKKSSDKTKTIQKNRRAIESSSDSAIPLERMVEHAERAASLMRSMSNENRLMILCSLIHGEMSVSELNDRVLLSQSALSQHLASLRDSELVETRRESQTIYYRLKGTEALKVIRILHEIYCPEM